MPRAGHMPPVENPAAFIDALTSFVNAHPKLAAVEHWRSAHPDREDLDEELHDGDEHADAREPEGDPGA